MNNIAFKLMVALLAALTMLSVTSLAVSAEEADGEQPAAVGFSEDEGPAQVSAEDNELSALAAGSADYAAAVNEAEAAADGIRIYWKKNSEVGGVAIYRLKSDGWHKIAASTDSSYLDKNVSYGEEYTYTVRPLDGSNNPTSDKYDEKGFSVKYLKTPTVSAENAAGGVRISWDKVTGAEKYRVFYKNSKGGWSRLATTSETSFLDDDVRSDHSYTYTVRCVASDGETYTSYYDRSGKSVRYIAAPVLTLNNAEDGVSIKWSSVAGASKYRVYYKGSRGWTRLEDTTKTSVLDTDVKSGTNYTYTIRALDSNGGFLSYYYTDGFRIRFIRAPEFSLSNAADGVKISWNASGGAEKYRVFYYGSRGWTKLVDTSETSFIDTDVSSNHNYKYTVRCITADGTSYTSDYRAGKSIKFYAAPKPELNNEKDGVSIKWSAISGASKYRVYYKGRNGWTRLSETSGTSVLDKDVNSGSNYTYTVRALDSKGNFLSYYYTDGFKIKFIAAPTDLKAESYKNSVRISWTPSKGAEKYRVYYYGSKGWTKLSDTSESYVIDTDVSSNHTYRYTVRCISSDGSKLISDCEIPGVSCKYISMPSLKAADFTSNGIKLSWTKPVGAVKYRVYYYGSRGWTKLTETTSDSVVDTDVSSGHNYRYTVRCITSDGKQFTSDFESPGLRVFYVSAPKITEEETSSDKITFSWNKPNGAEKFRVYKKINGSWTRLADTTLSSYTDTDVEDGKIYTYAVRVVNIDGNVFYSGFVPADFTAQTAQAQYVDGFVYYDQTRYSYPYGDDTIAYSGCGPTCFAMIASTLTGKSVTPIDAVKWCGNKYYVDNVGTAWSYFSAASDKFGIKMEKQLGGSEFSSVVSALKSGKYVISAQSRGIFTRGGHFIVLAGITSNGKIIVYDPNGGNHYVGTTFNQSDITASGTQYWVFTKK